MWRERLPWTETGLAVTGLGFFHYRVGDAGAVDGAAEAPLTDLLASGALVAEPIVYEDFLPRSAAGIFQSNLTDKGSRDDEQLGTPYDLARLSEVVGIAIADPNDLYAAQQAASLAEAEAALGNPIDTTPAPIAQLRAAQENASA